MFLMSWELHISSYCYWEGAHCHLWQLHLSNRITCCCYYCFSFNATNWLSLSLPFCVSHFLFNSIYYHPAVGLLLRLMMRIPGLGFTTSLSGFASVSSGWCDQDFLPYVPSATTITSSNSCYEYHFCHYPSHSYLMQMKRSYFLRQRWHLSVPFSFYYLTIPNSSYLVLWEWSYPLKCEKQRRSSS